MLGGHSFLFFRYLHTRTSISAEGNLISKEGTQNSKGLCTPVLKCACNILMLALYNAGGTQLLIHQMIPSVADQEGIQEVHSNPLSAPHF